MMKVREIDGQLVKLLAVTDAISAEDHFESDFRQLLEHYVDFIGHDEVFHVCNSVIAKTKFEA